VYPFIDQAIACNAVDRYPLAFTPANFFAGRRPVLTAPLTKYYLISANLQPTFDWRTP
jgi:hypothetical protein